ncbi:MAG: nucleoside deaminase [Bacteroidota bacterium]
MVDSGQQAYMRLAIQQAHQGQTPFGCLIIHNDQVIAQAFNTVSSSHDPTAHGEINTIRLVCQKLQSHKLPNTVLFTTGKPCPMCMSAILYAQIPQVIYGVSIATIAQFMPQITITSEEVA